jgi:stage 0 sporulation regulatory protein
MKVEVGGLVVNTEKNKQDLEEQIKEKRNEMIAIAEKYGFTDEETLKSSQELDMLLNKYMRFFRKPFIKDYPQFEFHVNNEKYTILV